MSYDAVVFDMDGVIIERSPSWVFDEAAQKALAHVGIDEPTGEEIRMARGLHGDLDRAQEHFQTEHDVGFDPIWRRRNELVTAHQREAIEAGEKGLYDDASAIPGLPGPRGIVSNNQHSAVEMVLDRFELDDRFDSYYGLKPGTGDIGAEKPNTVYLDRVLADLDADSAIYIGDRGSDVQAAHEAGIDAAFVRREFNADDELDPTPRYDVDSLHKLVDHLDGHAAAD